MAKSVVRGGTMYLLRIVAANCRILVSSPWDAAATPSTSPLSAVHVQATWEAVEPQPPPAFSQTIELQQRLSDATREAERLANVVKKAATAFESAFGELGGSMRKAKEGLDADIESLRGSLQSSVSTMTANVESASNEIQAATIGIASAVRSVDQQIGASGKRLSDRMDRLGDGFALPVERLENVVAGLEKASLACETTLANLLLIPQKVDALVGGATADFLSAWRCDR